MDCWLRVPKVEVAGPSPVPRSSVFELDFCTAVLVPGNRGKKLGSFYHDFYHDFGPKKTAGKKVETVQTDLRAFTTVEVETPNELRQLWPV